MPHFLMSDHWTLLKDYLKNQRKFRHTQKNGEKVSLIAYPATENSPAT